MTKEEYILLYERCASGQCTDEEVKLLALYDDEFHLDNAEWDVSIHGNETDVADQIYSQLYAQMHPRPVRRLSHIYKYAAAAVLFLVLGTGLYIYQNNSNRQALTAQKVAGNTDIAPGGKKAVLTLHDGSKMVLDQTTNGVVSIQGNIVITKRNTGKVIYDSYNLPKNPSEKDNYNSINIPRGGEYELRLPDGTKVWLNSESSLKFPAVFSGRDRKVELTGEAYFEVAKNTLVPFKVYASGTEIEVLGTHFNVNAYRKSGVITSLLEGSVRLKASGNESLLEPGQQGITAADGKINVSKVNVLDAIAWKNGYFVYQDDSIYKIMEQAARWYDVEVEYVGDDVKSQTFYGKGDRYGNISELLKNIELTGTVQFKIEGRRVIVMSK